MQYAGSRLIECHGGVGIVFERAQPLYKQAYETIKKSILIGEYESGTDLVVSQLSEDYNVSRTPIREALRLLENEGLLIQDKMGATIMTLDKKDFEELSECRLMLEKEISRIAVKKISDEQLRAISDILKELEVLVENERYTEILELNTVFHEKIVEPCSNERLIQLLTQIRSMLAIYRVNILKDDDYYHEILNEHRKIYESLLTRDEAKVLAAIEEHFINDTERGMKLFK